MFGHLAGAGLTIDPADVIPPGTSDDDALALLANRSTHVLLVPFHAHRDPDGEQINGLKLIQRLDKELPLLRKNPILMPCTRTAYLTVSAILSGPIAERVLLISEDNLDDEALTDQIRDHVAEWP